MWRIWLLFDPRRALVALFTFLFVLALLTLGLGASLVHCVPGLCMNRCANMSLSIVVSFQKF